MCSSNISEQLDGDIAGGGGVTVPESQTSQPQNPDDLTQCCPSEWLARIYDAIDIVPSKSSVSSSAKNIGHIYMGKSIKQNKSAKDRRRET